MNAGDNPYVTACTLALCNSTSSASCYSRRTPDCTNIHHKWKVNRQHHSNAFTTQPGTPNKYIFTIPSTTSTSTLYMATVHSAALTNVRFFTTYEVGETAGQILNLELSRLGISCRCASTSCEVGYLSRSTRHMSDKPLGR
jgi:hypothetical protein